MATRKKATSTKTTATTPKKATKKTTTKKAAKPETTPEPKPETKSETKDEIKLRKPQLRILDFLSRQKTGKTRADIAEGSPVDQASCVEYLGSHDEAKRAKNDETKFVSLLTLGYVAAEVFEPTDGGRASVVYTITESGRNANSASK